MELVSEAPAGAGAAAALRRLAANASVEATPGRILKRQGLAGLLPAGTRVYVPFLPRADFAATVAATRRLVDDGLAPVPHLTARVLESRGELDDRLGALADAGADSLLLIAGDRDRPAGPFASTLDVIETGLPAERGFLRLAVAGHPEGHAAVDGATLDAALAAKVEYARATDTELRVVTQFLFSATAAIDWLARLADRHPGLPVHLGLAGPARLATLLSYAAHCGVGASARILKRNPGAARLLAEWTPDGLLKELVRRGITEHDGAALFDGLHVYPFGGLEQSAAWLRGLGGGPAAADAGAGQGEGA